MLPPGDTTTEGRIGTQARSHGQNCGGIPFLQFGWQSGIQFHGSGPPAVKDVLRKVENADIL